MLKNAILRQKEEKKVFILNDFVVRQKEQEKDVYLKSNLIKVVLGPRRAGKSVFLSRILKDINNAYFNFEDEVVNSKEFTTYDLMEKLHEVYGEFKFVFFDEIQNLAGWETFLNRLHRQGYTLFVTGSNANLLSQELATALTGRHLSIEIFPFSFQEILAVNNQKEDNSKLSLNAVLEKYLQEGGFPEIVLQNAEPKNYLNLLLDSLIFKDVVRRYKIKKGDVVANLNNYFLNNVTSLYNIKNIANRLGFKSETTTEKHLNHLMETYIFFSLQKYSFKTTSRINSPRKVYTVDNGYILAKSVPSSHNNGKLLENLVFVELLKKGLKPNQNLFYYLTKENKEVDFVIKDNLQAKQLFQVCYSLNNLETEDREVRALTQAANELEVDDLCILTWAEEREIVSKGKRIKVIPFHKYFGF